jgi:Tol biopolymer transport system component/DNA-binding winged helix-turn-helix (wHTH) protein
MVRSAQPRTVRFGLFEANLATGELFKAGQKINLERQPFIVLTLLVEAPGELVTRDELQAALWPDGSFVDFNRGLNVAVTKLRDALGDSSDNPRFIETLPRRGYRFIAPTDWVQEANTDEISQPEQRKGWLSIWGWAGVTIALAAVALFYWRARSHQSREASNLEAKPIPLTSYAGYERSPALSPDGKQVAFSWDGENRDNRDIYVKLLDTSRPVRLTTDPGIDDMPTWSPDGRRIAFVRTEKSKGQRTTIRLISSLGGSERELIELAPGECYSYGTLSWSPDGEWLAFADKPKRANPFTIHVVSLETGEKRKVTSVDAGLYGDQIPAFSPDGRNLAFIRLKNPELADVYVMPLPGGNPRRLTHDSAGVFGLSWTSDGKELVFSSDRGGGGKLWRVPVSGGVPKARPWIDANDIIGGVSTKQTQLVFALEIDDENIWELHLEDRKMTGPPRPLITSTRNESNPQPSPDGKRIAFASNRSGAWEIWTSDNNGRNPIRITSTGRGTSAWPTWSPDGRLIAFNSNMLGCWEIYVVDSLGGKPRALTTGSDESVAPAWSRDGNWIYFQSDRSGTSQIWKISLQGGTAIQVTKNGGLRPAVSPDGKLIYYAKGNEIWRVPFDGGEEKLVVAGVPGAEYAHWTAANGGVYFRASEDTPTMLKYLNFKNGRITPVMPIDKIWDVSALAVSSDGRSLLYPQLDQSGSDLMLVENFR